MRRWRFGLSAKFGAVAAVGVLALLALVLIMLQRQAAMRTEVVALGGESMRSLVVSRLQKRGEATIVQIADSLVNPLYYFDLDAIGHIAREAMRQPDVSYVLVYDTNGDVIHDGSGDIPTYGQAMSDPLAYEVVSARGPHTQWTSDVLDVSAPISVGGQRLGGVRVGFSLRSARADEAQASATMVQRLEEIGRRHQQWIVLLMLTVAALAALLGYALQRTLVRPIRQLADVAREIEAGNYGAQVPDSRRNDEVGDLLRAFGRMGEGISRHDRDIRRMAYTDPLTGLSNRLAFRENLERRVTQLQGAGRTMALLFADIDDFKRVNDSLGHDAGDEVLVQFATRIREGVERYAGGGAVLARFGGDEFVVLLEADERGGTDMRALASSVAENLVAELSRPIRVQDRQVFLGTSIGITLFPDDARDATVLMKNGDIAMYQAKVAGKNCYRFFSRAIDEAMAQRIRMEGDLRGAWERGELTLAYQPVYRLSDRKLVGAEALLRWKHHDQGNVPPAAFIDIAEQSGLIERIGPEVLRAACRDAASWKDAHGHLPFVSVNVSPRQLRSGGLPAHVARALREAGLPADRLHLELTETAVISDERQASALLAQLRGEGVCVWLDDFGTGFSGLSHLRRVPIDGVKIDRSFVSDVTRDPDDLALTTAIIAMAHSLGITVVAEGIETEDQFDLLRGRGCDLGQGFLLGHPASAADIAALANA